MNTSGEEPKPETLSGSTVRRRVQRRKKYTKLWNTLTLLAFIGTILAAGVITFVYFNPSTALNPFPPRPTIEPFIVPTFPPTATPLPITPSPTIAPSPTATQTPTTLPEVKPTTAASTVTITPTAAPSAIPTVIILEATPAPGVTQVSSTHPFILRGDPVMVSSDITHPDQNCKLWVGGQVYNLQGGPFLNALVMIGGTLDGRIISQTAPTGTALSYGQSGFEFMLLDKVITSKRTVWVQLMDLQSFPLSQRVYFDTSDDCKKNLTLINFKQVR